MFDPTVDILTAEWHPFKETTWLKPLLIELSDWREKMDAIEKEIYEQSNITDVTFIADFPGI
jgi:vitamin K-dependent gamma-carboxylase